MGCAQNLLRTIPKIDEMLQDERLIFFTEKRSHDLVVKALRKTADRLRRDILSGKTDFVPSCKELVDEAIILLSEEPKYNLKNVINLTGVIVHTNLGRSILSKRAIEAVCNVAGGYSNLEYNIEKGGRGLRHVHIEKILGELTDAEAAMVVNNNAAAVNLCLGALTKGREVIVSRGELVEIGGSFRVPEIMEESGAKLREIGTTNRTHLRDYENAINENTAAFLKVHTSNYKICGFTKEVLISELSELKKKYDIPIIYDMGSGLFFDLKKYGIDEMTVKDVLEAGADVVLFSGDKLLGGPQAGIAIGKKKYIDLMKAHPLARAFRVDKMTIAALEATLCEYRDFEEARKDIPTLRMITADQKLLEEKAIALAECIKEKIDSENKDLVYVDKIDDLTGGGAAPTVRLPGYGVYIKIEEVERAEHLLRKAEIPVIVRVGKSLLMLSVRTLKKKDFEYVSGLISEILSKEV